MLFSYLLCSSIIVSGMAAARLAAANWSQSSRLPMMPVIPGLVPGQVVSSEGLSSPMTPLEEHKPFTAPLNIDYSTKVCPSLSPVLILPRPCLYLDLSLSTISLCVVLSPINLYPHISPSHLSSILLCLPLARSLSPSSPPSLTLSLTQPNAALFHLAIAVSSSHAGSYCTRV